MYLISPVTAVTVDPRRRIITDAALLISRDKIKDIGKRAELEQRYPGVERVDGAGMLALPGFIDAHAHTDQTILRSAGDDLPWRPFLTRLIWPLLGTRVPEDALISLKLCMLEMLKSGTTCFVDSIVPAQYPFDELARSIEEMGLRGVLAKYVLPQAIFDANASFGNQAIRSERESLTDAEVAIRNWHGAAGGRIQVWFGPLVPREEPPAACSPAFYKKVANLAGKHRTGITIHLGATQDDVVFFDRKFGMTPAEFAQQHGLLGANVLLINGTWFSESELPLLAETNTKLVHSPSANMKMADGIARVPAMRAAGITVALGCDAAANNNCLDMIREMKMASLLHKVSTMDAGVLTAEDALEMATIEGARAIGKENELGSLEIGKQADLILVDLKQPHTMPVHDPIANLIYAAHGGNVDTVIVAGKVLMRHREVLTANEQDILEEAQVRGAALLERSGIQARPAWPVE